MTKLQGNKLRDEGRTIEVFTHATMGHFNVTWMRKAQLAMPGTFKSIELPFDNFRAPDVEGTAQVIEWLVGQREIDEERIKALTDEELEDPVMMVFDTNNNNAAYMVDGIHRLVGRFRRGDKTFKFIPWPLELCPMLPKDAALFNIPWGEKDVVGEHLVNVRTGEKS